MDIIKTIFSREPLVIVNAIAGTITAFVAEAQGELEGQHAWMAVGWALIALASRHFVSPAKSPS